MKTAQQVERAPYNVTEVTPWAQDWHGGYSADERCRCGVGFGLGVDVGLTVGFGLDVDVGMTVGFGLAVDVGFDAGFGLAVDIGFDAGFDLAVEPRTPTGSCRWRRSSRPVAGSRSGCRSSAHTLPGLCILYAWNGETNYRSVLNPTQMSRLPSPARARLDRLPCTKRSCNTAKLPDTQCSTPMSAHVRSDNWSTGIDLHRTDPEVSGAPAR
jgi:hypothetical protein